MKGISTCWRIVYDLDERRGEEVYVIADTPEEAIERLRAAPVKPDGVLPRQPVVYILSLTDVGSGLA